MMNVVQSNIFNNTFISKCILLIENKNETLNQQRFVLALRDQFVLKL